MPEFPSSTEMRRTTMQYELRIAHLYGNLMNTYGDYGNVLALKYYGKKMGVQVDSNIVSLEENFNADDYDLAVFGGGQDLEQSIVSKDLKNKKDQLIKFINEGKPMIAVCGGYQLLGKYYETDTGKKIQGINAMNHYTIPKNGKRFSDNMEIIDKHTNQKFHGYENHQGATYLGKGERPLGTVLKGHGNNGKDHSEGAVYKHTYCTYFHGPVLTRNPKLAKTMLLEALHNKYPHNDFTKQKQLKVNPTY